MLKPDRSIYIVFRNRSSWRVESVLISIVARIEILRSPIEQEIRTALKSWKTQAWEQYLIYRIFIPDVSFCRRKEVGRGGRIDRKSPCTFLTSPEHASFIFLSRCYIFINIVYDFSTTFTSELFPYRGSTFASFPCKNFESRWFFSGRENDRVKIIFRPGVFNVARFRAKVYTYWPGNLRFSRENRPSSWRSFAVRFEPFAIFIFARERKDTDARM